tara:strand:- start:218 stop:1372 length:1155 start_codon:yes stop_codon:yes gene_type:complete
MGYQRVVKPRFYVDMMSYLHAIGHSKYFDRYEDEHADTPTDRKIHEGNKTDLLYSNPQSLLKFTLAQSQTYTTFNYQDFNGEKLFPNIPIDCVVMLNHNLANTKCSGGIASEDGDIAGFGIGTNYLNWDRYIAHNGFSIRILSGNATWIKDAKRAYLYFHGVENNLGERYIGSYFFGKTYSPPHNPNLSMTVSRTFDGIKQSKTRGGHTINNIDHIGNPDWAGHNAWELWDYPEDPAITPPNETPNDSQQPMLIEDSKLNLGRLGRRSWKLTFDLVNETDIFGPLEQSNILPFGPDSTFPETNFTFAQQGYGMVWDNPLNLMENFISRVWIPTLGGTIPMLIQLDDTNKNPDNFAIVTIKQNSFNVTPKAPNLYNYSMVLEETW